MNKTQLDAVKSYIKKKDESRPILSTIQTSKSGKQFILDGYTAFMWHEFQKDFDSLPTTPEKESINIDMIMPSNDDEVIVEQIDLLVWKYIDKYLGYIKTYEKDLLEDAVIKVYFCGRVFDYQFIRTAKTFCGKLQDCKLFNNGEKVPLKIASKDVAGIILPHRVDSVDEHKQRAWRFLESL